MLIKNIYTRVGANALTGLIGFASSVVVVWVFGAEVIGRIAYYYAIAAVFSIFTDLGLSTAYNKFLATEQKPHEIAAYIFLKLILTAVYVIIFFATWFITLGKGDLDMKLLFIVFGGVLADLFAQIFTATYVSRRDFLALSKLEIAAAVLIVVYNLVVCFMFRSIYLLAVNRIVASLVLIIGGVFYFHRNKLVRSLRPEWATIKRYFHYSLPIAFSSIVGIFTNHVDRLIVGRLIGETEVGLYEIAKRFHSMIDKLIKPATNTLFTEIVHRITNTPSFFKDRFRDLAHVLNFAGCAIALALVFTSTTLIICFFGVENVRAAFVLKFFSLAIIAKILWRPYNHVIYSLEKHKLVLYAQPFNVVVMIACYWLLVPLKIGGATLGAAALPLTEFIIWFFPAGIIKVWILRKKYDNLFIIDTLLKTWLPLLIIITAGYFFKFSIFAFPVAFAIFLAAEYFLGVLTKDRCDELIKPLKTLCAKPQ